MASLSSLLMFIVVLPTLIHSLHIFDSVSNSISIFTTWRSIKMGRFRRFTSTEANEGVIRGHLGRIEPGDPLRVVATPAWGERDMAWRLLKDHFGPAKKNRLTRKKWLKMRNGWELPFFQGDVRVQAAARSQIWGQHGWHAAFQTSKIENSMVLHGFDGASCRSNSSDLERTTAGTLKAHTADGS